MRYLSLLVLAAVLLGGCHAAPTPPPPPVTHENILTVTPSASATSATQYNFYRSTSGGPFVLINPTPQFALTYDDLEITAGVVYEYRATAVVYGIESAPCPVTVTIVAK
jgi:hypothetical protein